MKKQTFKKLTLNKAEISKLENIKGGIENAAHGVAAWPQTCLGDVCPFTMFFVCPSREQS